MENPGDMIKRLRNGKGWTRPELGRQMAKALGRAKPFTGELIRLYETHKNRPGKPARKALAVLFGKSEQQIEFGEVNHASASSAPQQPSIDSPEVIRLALAFGWLTKRQKAELLKDVESKAATNKAIHKELGAREFEFKQDEEVARHLKPLPPAHPLRRTKRRP